MRKTLQAALRQVRLAPADLAGLSEVDRFAGTWSVRPHIAAQRLETIAVEVGRQAALAALSYDGVEAHSDETVAPSGGQLSHSRLANNYKAAALWIADEAAQLSLSEALVADLHRRVFRGMTSAAADQGRHRNGAHGDRLRPAIAAQAAVIPEVVIPTVMTELVEWYHERVQYNDCHPLYPVAVFVVQFLRISPFAAGNGRMALLLLRYLLLRAGYGFVSLAAVEIHCLEDGFPGPDVLAKGHDPEPVRWNIAFSRLVDVLFQAVLQLQALAAAEARAPDRLPDLSNRILRLLATTPRAQVSEIAARSRANRNTVKLHLRRLVTEGLLVRHGAGRSTWYQRAEP